MRRTLAIAGLAVGAALFAAPAPASACDPNRPPFCQTPCTITRDLYNFVYRTSGGYEGPLPSWYELGLMQCG
jgi:hypothetical protein